MDRRKHRRVQAQVQGCLLANSHEIEAITFDLSTNTRRQKTAAMQAGTRDMRDGRRFGVDSSRFSGLRTWNPELRIAPCSHGTCHGLLADVFSLSLMCRSLTDPHWKNIVSVWEELNAPREYGS